MIRKHTHTALKLVGLCTILVLSGCSSRDMPLLYPAGPIGAHEKTLIVTAFILMLIVAIPVFAMTFLFAWKYRASNKKATYAPKWAHSNAIEVVVWTVPALIVGALGYLVWTDTHALTPYKPLASSEKPVRIEAIALNWKWLFIYPDLHIATVNQIEFPAGVPVNFRITSDTVMTSFFIPRLGTQIYAMAGMRTKLHLLANRTGTFVGRNFQLSGRGYSSMHFKAVATTPAKFHQWLHKVRNSDRTLTLARLHKLERPSIPKSVAHFASVQPHLFRHVIEQYHTARTTEGKSNT